MQILLVGDEDCPLKNQISKLLDFHSRINKIDFVLSPGINTIQRLAHCVIYISRSPSWTFIDKLIEYSPLVLIAEADYRSQLFIPIDNLISDADEAWQIFMVSINSLVSLYDMEYQTNFWPLAMPEMAMKKIERLREDPLELERSLSPTTGDDTTPRKETEEHPWLPVVHSIATNKLDPFRDTKDLCTFKKLSDDHKKLLARVCDGVSKGQRHEKIYRDLNMSKSSYYRAFDLFRLEFGTMTNKDLIERIMTLVNN